MDMQVEQGQMFDGRNRVSARRKGDHTPAFLYRHLLNVRGFLRGLAILLSLIMVVSMDVPALVQVQTDDNSQIAQKARRTMLNIHPKALILKMRAMR